MSTTISPQLEQTEQLEGRQLPRVVSVPDLIGYSPVEEAEFLTRAAAEGLVPPTATSAGAEAVALMARTGQILDPWQVISLELMLLERADGKWACFEFGLLASRQNGKGAILEARVLAGLYLFDDEQFIAWSAHEFKTAKKAYFRLKELIDRTPSLKARVKHRARSPWTAKGCPTCLAGATDCVKVTGFKESNEQTSVEVALGGKPDKATSEVRFMARNKSSGRGFTGDVTILDEAQELSAKSIDAMLPTLLAKTMHGNPQVIYTGTVPEATNDSEKWQSVRDRGRSGVAVKRFGWVEFTPGDDLEDIDLDDPRVWADANPALGRRISVEGIEAMRDAMTDEGFAREVLSVWGADQAKAAIASAVWKEREDPGSQIATRFAYGIEVDEGQTRAWIGVAGRRADKRRHVELITTNEGTEWVVEAAKAINRGKAAPWVIDALGPAASLVPALQEAGLDVRLVNGTEMARACGLFYATATTPLPGGDGTLEVDVPIAPEAAMGLHHLGQAPLNVAVSVGRKQKKGSQWVWRRTVEALPLIAVTLALYGSETRPKKTTGRSRTGYLPE